MTAPEPTRDLIHPNQSTSKFVRQSATPENALNFFTHAPSLFHYFAMKNLLVDSIGKLFKSSRVISRCDSRIDGKLAYSLCPLRPRNPRSLALLRFVTLSGFSFSSFAQRRAIHNSPKQPTPAVRNVPNDSGSVTGRIRISGLLGEGMAGRRKSTMPLKVLCRAKGQRCNVRQLNQPSVGIGKPLREDVQKVKRSD